MESTNQRQTPGCSNFDVRDIYMDQNQCANKNKLMLTIKNKRELDNSKIGDGKQILNTVVNTSENSNATKIQEISSKGGISKKRTPYKADTSIRRTV